MREESIFILESHILTAVRKVTNNGKFVPKNWIFAVVSVEELTTLDKKNL